MSEVPTGLTGQTTKWIATCLPTLYAAGAALSISALMSLYDGESLLKTATGSLVCGIVTLAVAGSLEYLGLPSNAVTFVGASIGFMGADKVRNKVTGLIAMRIGGVKMSKNGLALLRSFENCKLSAYQDSAGVWTIGYGWTQPVNGVPVSKGMTITRATADSLLSSGVVQYEQRVRGLVNVAVNQNQFDALVDFAYNLGVNALAGSILLKKLNAADYAGAADEFPKWNSAGGRVLNGLVKRRAAERSLFLS